MKFDLKSLANDWNHMFLNDLESKKIHPIAEYQPSLAYRNLADRNHIKMTNEIRLNIAAGPNVFPYNGWINYDREAFKNYFEFLHIPNLTTKGMPEAQARLLEFIQDGGKIDFRVQNMCDGFPQHDSNSITGIYVGQAIEHLSPVHQVPAFLKECHRILQPGGVLRMTTPDLDILIDSYRSNMMEKFDNDQPEFYKSACPSMKLSYIMFGAGGENCTQTNYEGHMVLFTRTSMSKIMEAAGFHDITFYTKPNVSKDPVMAEQVKDEGLSHSMIVEGVK